MFCFDYLHIVLNFILSFKEVHDKNIMHLEVHVLNYMYL